MTDIRRRPVDFSIIAPIGDGVSVLVPVLVLVIGSDIALSTRRRSSTVEKVVGRSFARPGIADQMSEKARKSQRSIRKKHRRPADIGLYFS